MARWLRLRGFVTDHVEPRATVITDGWAGYSGLEKIGYVHDRRSQRAARACGEDPGALLPAVRWPNAGCWAPTRARWSRRTWPAKDGPVRLQIDQAPRARNRRMIGWRLVHGQPQKAADRQRVRLQIDRRATQSSNDRVAPRSTAESCGPPTSPSRATPSSRCLRSSRPAAGGSSARVPSSVGPSRARRTGRTGLRRTDRSGAHQAASSAARRMDGPARWAGPTSRSTAAVDPSRAFP